MEAKSLRLGNWLVGYDGIEFQWDLQHFKLVAKKIEVDEIGIPIPLTEEWLLRFGFKGPKSEAGKYYSLSKHRVYLFDSGCEFEFNICETLRVNLHHRYKQIQHVHQLQNLYFALTGEELTQLPQHNPDQNI